MQVEKYGYLFLLKFHLFDLIEIVVEIQLVVFDYFEDRLLYSMQFELDKFRLQYLALMKIENKDLNKQ